MSVKSDSFFLKLCEMADIFPPQTKQCKHCKNIGERYLFISPDVCIFCEPTIDISCTVCSEERFSVYIMENGRCPECYLRCSCFMCNSPFYECKCFEFFYRGTREDRQVRSAAKIYAYFEDGREGYYEALDKTICRLEEVFHERKIKFDHIDLKSPYKLDLITKMIKLAISTAPDYYRELDHMYARKKAGILKIESKDLSSQPDAQSQESRQSELTLFCGICKRHRERFMFVEEDLCMDCVPQTGHEICTRCDDCDIISYLMWNGQCARRFVHLCFICGSNILDCECHDCIIFNEISRDTIVGYLIYDTFVREKVGEKEFEYAIQQLLSILIQRGVDFSHLNLSSPYKIQLVSQMSNLAMGAATEFFEAREENRIRQFEAEERARKLEAEK